MIKQGLSDSADRCWQVFRQIVEGLNHIHGHGIVHRDLKPDNIFADITGSARIGDFGLATSGRYYLVDSASAAGGDVQSNMTRSIGTALYVAPEMRSGANSHYNEKVDVSIWSILRSGWSIETGSVPSALMGTTFISFFSRILQG